MFAFKNFLTIGKSNTNYIQFVYINFSPSDEKYVMTKSCPLRKPKSITPNTTTTFVSKQNVP